MRVRATPKVSQVRAQFPEGDAHKLLENNDSALQSLVLFKRAVCEVHVASVHVRATGCTHLRCHVQPLCKLHSYHFDLSKHASDFLSCLAKKRDKDLHLTFDKHLFVVMRKTF